MEDEVHGWAGKVTGALSLREISSRRISMGEM